MATQGNRALVINMFHYSFVYYNDIKTYIYAAVNDPSATPEDSVFEILHMSYGDKTSIIDYKS